MIRTCRSRLAGVCLLALAVVAGCSTSGVRPDGSGGQGSAQQDVLTEKQALARSQQVRNVRYDLEFDLPADSDTFGGVARLEFELLRGAREISSVLPIDFAGGGKVLSVAVNGEPVARPVYNGVRILLDISGLAEGKNRVEIHYTHPYSTSGDGLHRFEDPVDKKVYVYSNLEPYHAHHIFPCFDQPDLKASYAVKVNAPADWQVVTNTRETEVTDADGGRRIWNFPPSPVFSTYIFALMGGPYEVWTDQAGTVPLRLMARKSLAKHVDHQDWFAVTKAGLKFFNRAFGFPYPFGKYDQLIVPDFNAGAMENVGAVTFSERYVHRSKTTAKMRADRAEVILHEMAHMWFGNLVTMKWWNGLWLNESFATFSASWAMDSIASELKLPGAWESFFADMKKWAYWEDQLVTTHPIEVAVPDTSHAFAIFDGITYGKGASSLKQLYFFLGEDAFKRGMQIYFQRFAYRNTTLADFMGMLAEASGKDLKDWQKKWLETSGVNTVKVKWSCEKGRISSFQLLQAGADAAGDTDVLRPHRTKVALYYLDGSELKKRATATVTYDSAVTEVPELKRRACPDLVYPNDGDHDFVKVVLDPVSLKTVREHISKLDRPMERQMIWHTLWEMVIDGRLAPQAYAEIAMDHLEAETDELVVKDVTGDLVQPYAGWHSVLKFLHGKSREEYAGKFEKFFWERLSKAQPGSDAQLTWYKAYINVAHSARGQRRMRNWHRRWEKLAGFEFDQDRRWELLTALARNGYDGIDGLIAAELKRDPTDKGRKSATVAEVSRPNAEVKKKWLDLALRRTDERLPVAKLRPAMSAFHVLGQEELSRLAIEPFMDSLPKLARSEEAEYLSNLAENMFPPLCEPALIKAAEEMVEDHEDLPAIVRKALRVQAQELKRCLRAQQVSAFWE